MMQFFRKNVRSIMLVVVVLFVISCFAGYGMYNRGGGGGDETAPQGERDYVVAVVDGENIMRSRMDFEVAQMIQATGMAATISDDDLPAIRSNILDQMAVMAEFDKEVTARNITTTAEEIDSTIKEIEGSFPTREIFLQEMERAGMDEARLRSEVETQLRRQKVLEQVIAPASADEQELRTFYDMLKEYAFQKPEAFLVNLAHFRTEESALGAKESVDSGTSWDDVMLGASADVLNYTTYENTIMIPISEMQGEVAFLLDAPMNEVTAPVMLASEDYMIVVKREKQEAGTATYDEVSADIEAMILNQKQQGLQSQFMQELRARAAVEILDPEIFATREPIDVASIDQTIENILAESDDVSTETPAVSNEEVEEAEAAAETTAEEPVAASETESDEVAVDASIETPAVANEEVEETEAAPETAAEEPVAVNETEPVEVVVEDTSTETPAVPNEEVEETEAAPETTVEEPVAASETKPDEVAAETEAAAETDVEPTAVSDDE